jgi:lysophospholipase L1-like esterase
MNIPHNSLPEDRVVSGPLSPEATHLATDPLPEQERLPAEPKIAGMKLAIFGSSVAQGAGAQNSFGWGNRLKAVLEKKNWSVVNKSIGGDSTIKLLARFERDLVSEHPDMVIIGLSLANEGIMEDPPAIYAQYLRNLRKLIQLCHQHHIIPIVANCYPNNSYDRMIYDYIRKANEELNSWPVASLDFLGAVDDGHGHWQKDCWVDNGHPNDLGHEEMLHSIPISMFDNLIDPSYPLAPSEKSWLQCGAEGVTTACLSYSPESAIHSFTYVFTVSPLASPKPGCVFAAVDRCQLVVGTRKTWEIHIGDGLSLSSEITVNHNQKYHLGLTHSFANRQLHFYIDGQKIGAIPTRLVPETFYLAGGRLAGSPKSLFRNCLLYRACLDDASMSALAAGTLLRSSLELYAPLSDHVLAQDLLLLNKAQTGAHLRLNTDSCQRVYHG